MATPNEPTRKPIVVDEAMLRAFAKGQLDEAAEDRIAALLEERPDLQEKVASISTDGILSKMKAHREILASKSLSSQIGVGSSVSQSRQVSETVSARPQTPIDLPAELSELSEYRIIKELGRGGMGVVYLAEHTLTGRKEVLKVLNERLMEHSEARKRFEQEVRCIASVDHDAIVRCYSVRMMARTIILAMEHLPGSDLHQFIARNGRLPLHLACGIATEVCSGLQHAMDVGLVHRDIKPSNIMVFKSSGRLRAKILDFGLGRPAESNPTTGLTQDGTLLGTLEYISPEQSMDANKVDIRSDIYSLGCTLYHMLVGHPPFSGSQGELIMAHAQKTPPTINLIRPEVPVELADVVARMMAKEPSRRYATPKDVAVALKPFLSRKVTEIEVPNLSKTDAPETRVAVAEAELDTSVEAVGDRKQPTAIAAIAPRIAIKAGKLDSVNADSQGPKTLVAAQPVSPPSRLRKGKRRSPILAVALGLMAFVVLVGAALGIILIQTATGTIVIEVNDPGFEVAIVGTEILLKQADQGKEIKLSPGDKTLIVQRDDFKFETDKLVLKRGETVTVRVELLAGEVRVHEGDKLLGQAKLPTSPAKAAPQEVASTIPPTVDVLTTEPRQSTEVPAVTSSEDLMLRFDQSDSREPNFVVEGMRIAPTSPLTIEGWCSIDVDQSEARVRSVTRPDGKDSIEDMRMFGFDEQFISSQSWYMQKSSFMRFRWCFYTSSGGYWPQAQGTTKKLQHVALVLGPVEDNHRRIKAFVNGVPTYDSHDFSEEGLERPNPMLSPFTGGPIQTGCIDEMRISSTARYDGPFVPERRFEPDAETIALYHCDEGSGDKLIDSSGNGFHGQLNTVRWVPADYPEGASIPAPKQSSTAASNTDQEVAGAVPPTADVTVIEPSQIAPRPVEGVPEDLMLRFDESNSREPNFVVEGLRLKRTHPLTIEGWCSIDFDETEARVRSTARSDGKDPLENMRMFGFKDQYISSQSWYMQKVPLMSFRWCFYQGNGGYTPTGQRKTKKLQHVALVFGPLVSRRRRVMAFVNGTIAYARPKEETLVLNPFTGGPIQTGCIDEMRISSTARYEGPFVPERRFEPDAETIALYHCDEGSGDRLLDSSGNGFHGRLNAARWVPADYPEGVSIPPPSLSSNTASSAANQTQPQAKLLDGKSLNLLQGDNLSQWNTNGAIASHWKLKGGVLRFDGAGREIFNLSTKRSFENFTLNCEWRISPGGDSGIFIRGIPQVQIWDHTQGKGRGIGSGGLYNNQSHPKDPMFVADNAIGEWNEMSVTIVGDRVTVRLNGRTVTENVRMENYPQYQQPLPSEGPIVLQGYGSPIEFRRITVVEEK